MTVSTVPGANAESQTTLTIVAGASFSFTLQYLGPDGVTPVDLIGWGCVAQVRRYADGPVLATFATDITEDTGEIALSLTSTQTAALVNGAKWDVVITNSTSSKAYRLAGGVVKLIARVSE